MVLVKHSAIMPDALEFRIRAPVHALGFATGNLVFAVEPVRFAVSAWETGRQIDVHVFGGPL